jgi:hypothetical protein
MSRSGSDGLHFSMSSNVAQGFRKIVSAGNDAPLANDDGANGHFASFASKAGFCQCLLHKANVDIRLRGLYHIKKG